MSITPSNITTEKVTPAIAERWLNTNKSNRKLREGVVEKYADDMRNGRWLECTAPIVFYEDGELADGQHRLWAVVESKRAQTFDIKRGLDRAAGLNIDIGLGRSIVDNAHISGVAIGITNELLGVARGIEDGTHANVSNKRVGVRSNAAKLEIAEKHRDAAQWAVSHGPRGKGIRNAITVAAVARAWYVEEDKDRLARFSHVLSTGFFTGDDETAAIALRNYLISRGSQTSSSPLWRDTFLKTMNAIHSFMRGRKLTVIKAIKDEMYPLQPKKRAARP